MFNTHGIGIYFAVSLAALYLADIFLDLELQIVHVVRLPLCATGMDHKELQGTTELLIVCGLLDLVLIHEFQGLQEEIELVPMDMADKPAWYKKVYPKNQVRLGSRYM